MSIISKNSFILEDDEENSTEEYVLPSIVTSAPEVIPIKKTLAISTALHPGVVLLGWLITIALTLMGININLFKKPDVQLKKDIEFVLVDKEAKPRDPNTKNRADMDSRSGGVNDPKRKVSMPSPTPKKASTPSPAPQKKQPATKPQPQKQIAQPAKQPQKQATTQQKQQTPVAKPSPAKPAPPTARPSSRPMSAPTPTAKPSTPFAVPAPSAPVGKTLSTGPVGGTSSSGTAKSSNSASSSTAKSSGSYAPRPSLSPSASGGSGTNLARGTSGAGNIGNPGGGGGAPGIDALREPDFGPYMRELQRRIKLNWDPPKGNESKRVVLLFKIAKDGRLLSCKIHKSSGLPSADQAALKAVELTAPFRPLPGDFKGQSIDIQFTFDYNVFGGSRYY